MWVTKQLMVAIDLYTVAWQKILWKSTATVSSLVTSILKNILFCVQQKKETLTGLEQLYGD